MEGRRADDPPWITLATTDYETAIAVVDVLLRHDPNTAYHLEVA